MTAPRPMDCATALRLLADHLDGELHGQAGDDLERHLHTCRSCFSRAEFERRLKQELTRLGRGDVRPAFERRIRQLVATFTAAGRDTTVNE